MRRGEGEGRKNKGPERVFDVMSRMPGSSSGPACRSCCFGFVQHCCAITSGGGGRQHLSFIHCNRVSEEPPRPHHRLMFSLSSQLVCCSVFPPLSFTTFFVGHRPPIPAPLVLFFKPLFCFFYRDYWPSSCHMSQQVHDGSSGQHHAAARCSRTTLPTILKFAL